MQKNPLYLVTHSELTSGYQTAQVAHAVADFAAYRTEQFVKWHKESQFVVALQCKNQAELEKLFKKAKREGYDVVAFHEEDLNGAMTSVAFSPHGRNKNFLSRLPLAGSVTGKTNKHNTAGLE